MHDRPDAVVHSEAGTFQVCAAAVTKSWRPAAPTCRMGVQLFGVAVLPPANCGANFVSSKSACSIFTDVPCDVQFLGDQHGQHRPDALADLGVLGDDGDRAVGGDLDEVVRIGRSPAAPRACAAASRSVPRANSTPPPASATILRKERRSIVCSVVGHRRPPRHSGRLAGSSRRRPGKLGGAVNRAPDAQVGSAPAQIAVQRVVDVLVGGLRLGSRAARPPT